MNISRKSVLCLQPGLIITEGYGKCSMLRKAFRKPKGCQVRKFSKGNKAYRPLVVFSPLTGIIGAFVPLIMTIPLKYDRIHIDEIPVCVTRKQMKHLHLRVNHVDGTVAISAPVRMNLELIRNFASAKIDWIREQLLKFRNSTRVPSLEFVDGEVHYYLGTPYVLKIVERNSAPEIQISPEAITMFVRPGSTRDKRESVMRYWYRCRLREFMNSRILNLEEKMNVRVLEWSVKTMKTRW